MPRLRLLLPLLALLAAAPAAKAEPMRVIDSTPRARSAMDGNRQEFSVRFDRPVDHNVSRLFVQRGDTVLRTLQPRLGASPDTLYAVAGGLAPGDYVLRWRTRPQGGQEMTEGSFDFTVRP